MRESCVYGACRAVNLCKGAHCVGGALRKRGYEIRDGVIEERSDASPDAAKVGEIAHG